MTCKRPAHLKLTPLAPQVEISKSYTKVEWREDLKKFLKKAGGEMQQVVFLFSDSQIKDESFVEDINNILNSGEVPNMFPMDEKLGIMELVRPAAAKKGLETQLELWGFFVQQVRIKRSTAMSSATVCFTYVIAAPNPKCRNGINCWRSETV